MRPNRGRFKLFAKAIELMSASQWHRLVYSLVNSAGWVISTWFIRFILYLEGLMLIRTSLQNMVFIRSLLKLVYETFESGVICAKSVTPYEEKL